MSREEQSIQEALCFQNELKSRERCRLGDHSIKMTVESYPQRSLGIRQIPWIGQDSCSEGRPFQTHLPLGILRADTLTTHRSENQTHQHLFLIIVSLIRHSKAAEMEGGGYHQCQPMD